LRRPRKLPKPKGVKKNASRLKQEERAERERKAAEAKARKREEERIAAEKRRKEEAAEARRRAEAAEEKRRQEAALAAAEAKWQELQARYTRAERLFRDEKYAEAKSAFEEIRREARAADITLREDMQEQISRYLSRIDEIEKEKKKVLTDKRLERLMDEKLRAHAAAATERGNELYAQGDMEGAAEEYKKALQYKPDYEPAKQRMSMIERTAERKKDYVERMLEEKLKQRDLELQQQRIEMDVRLREASEKGAQNEYDEALKIVQSVIDRIEINKEWPEDMRTKYFNQASSLLTKLKEDKINYVEAEEELKRREARRKAEEETTRLAEAREEQARALMEQVEVYIINKQYQNAEDLLSSMLEKDPNDLVVKDKLAAVRRLKHLYEGEKIDAKFLEQFKRHMREDERKRTPPFDVLTYPDKEQWQKITEMRRDVAVMDALDRSPEDQATYALLEKKGDFNFTEARLEDVVEYIRSVYDVNIVIDQDALWLRGEEILVTLPLKDVPLKTALKFMLEPKDLKYTVRDGIIFISTPERIEEDVIMYTYDVRDLVATIPDFGEAAGGAETTGTTGTTGTTRGGGTEGGAAEGEEEIGLQDLIQENVAPFSWEEDPRVSIAYRQGQLIVRQTREVHEEIRSLLSNLRAARALQVSVEARFITIRGGFIESIGFTILNLDFDFDMFEFGERINEFALATSLPFDLGVARNLSTSGGLAGELMFQFTDDIFLDMLISAVQKSQRADVMDAPVLTMFNGQAAVIEVETTTTYISGQQIRTAASAVGLEYQTSDLDFGVTLNVHPFVSADRRFVQMTLQPEIEQLLGLTSFPLANVINDQVFETVIQLPNIETTTISTTVSVPDNGTLMIGGLTATFDSENEAGVPVISKIPGLKRFFSRTVSSRERRNLLIIVRPRIIIQEESEPK